MEKQELNLKKQSYQVYIRGRGGTALKKLYIQKQRHAFSLAMLYFLFLLSILLKK